MRNIIPERAYGVMKVDIALPCATQNELTLSDAEGLVDKRRKGGMRGRQYAYYPGGYRVSAEERRSVRSRKAANAGGVATSALEMSQNSERLSWSFEEVDSKLQGIMINIFHNLDDAAKRYGMEGNYVAGANIAGI